VSRVNVDAVRRVLEAFNSGEIERVLAAVHPEFEAVVPPELSAEPDTYRGYDGARRYFETFDEAMEAVRFEPERIWEAGETLVVAMRMTARGKQTGIPVEQRFVQLWILRDGRALFVRAFPSLTQALAAAGLPPEAEAVDDHGHG
jgi:ketosteroid isomerase-like protein